MGVGTQKCPWRLNSTELPIASPALTMHHPVEAEGLQFATLMAQLLWEVHCLCSTFAKHMSAHSPLAYGMATQYSILQSSHDKFAGELQEYVMPLYLDSQSVMNKHNCAAI